MRQCQFSPNGLYYLGLFNPIPTGPGQNQPLYDCHVTKPGRNSVKEIFFLTSLNVYAVQLAMPHATVLNIDDVTLIGRTNRQPYAIQRIGQ